MSLGYKCNVYTNTMLDWLIDLFICVERRVQQYFSNIIATSFSGGRSRREPPTTGKQLVNFITCDLRLTIYDHFSEAVAWTLTVSHFYLTCFYLVLVIFITGHLTLNTTNRDFRTMIKNVGDLWFYQLLIRARLTIVTGNTINCHCVYTSVGGLLLSRWSSPAEVTFIIWN
jgi:hypothetical protein